MTWLSWLIAKLFRPAEPPAPQKPMPMLPTAAEIHYIFAAWRAERGLPYVALDSALCRTAQAHSDEMAVLDRLYHDLTPRPLDNEIVAQGETGSVSECLDLWESSPGHRAWLASQSRAVGFGIARSRSGKVYYTGNFSGMNPGDES